MKLLEFLKIMEWKLIDMFSNPSVIRKINNVTYKGYVNKKVNEKMDLGDTRHTKAILDSFKFKMLKRIKTEKSLEGDAVKIDQTYHH